MIGIGGALLLIFSIWFAGVVGIYLLNPNRLLDG